MILQNGNKFAPHPFVNFFLGTAHSLLYWSVRLIPTHFKSDHELVAARRVIIATDHSILFHALHRRRKSFYVESKLVSWGEEAISVLITVTIQIDIGKFARFSFNFLELDAYRISVFVFFTPNFLICDQSSEGVIERCLICRFVVSNKSECNPPPVSGIIQVI